MIVIISKIILLVFFISPECPLFAATQITFKYESNGGGNVIGYAKKNSNRLVGDCSFVFGKSSEADTKFECDNLNNFNSKKVCQFNISVGITRYPDTISLSDTIKFLQVKADALPDTPTLSSRRHLWRRAVAEEISLQVPPGSKQTLYQLVGVCGSEYELRTGDKHFEVANAPSTADDKTNLGSLEWQYFKTGSFPESSEEDGFEFYSSKQNMEYIPLLPKPAFKYDCEDWDTGCISKENGTQKMVLNVAPRAARSKGTNILIFLSPQVLQIVYLGGALLHFMVVYLQL